MSVYLKNGTTSVLLDGTSVATNAACCCGFTCPVLATFSGITARCFQVESTEWLLYKFTGGLINHDVNSAWDVVGNDYGTSDWWCNSRNFTGSPTDIAIRQCFDIDEHVACETEDACEPDGGWPIALAVGFISGGLGMGVPDGWAVVFVGEVRVIFYAVGIADPTIPFSNQAVIGMNPMYDIGPINTNIWAAAENGDCFLTF